MIRILAATIAMFASVPLSAQASGPANPHLALATALTSDDQVDDSYAHAIEGMFKSTLRADPSLAVTEAECPGLIDAMVAAGEPIMRPAHQRDFLIYRDKLTRLFANEMSGEHAAEGAAFFGSALGKRFLASLAMHPTIGGVSGATPAAATPPDARAGLDALEPLDRREIEGILGGSAWALEFSRLQPRIAEAQLEMATSDYLPSEDAAMDQAFAAAAETHLTACYAKP